MTGLLVSVRDVAEARIALASGVDLVDLKEPTRGALGPVDPATAAKVVEFIAGRVPVSAALGELLDLSGSTSPSLAVSRGLAFVKAGLSNCAARPDWSHRLTALSQSLPESTSLVAVVYADAAAVGAPGVDEILEAAAAANCRAVLVDTAIKDGRSLLDHWPLKIVRRFVADVRHRGLTCVVGGSLTLEKIPALAECGPDYIAVRGAACAGDRAGSIDAARIRALREALRS